MESCDLMSTMTYPQKRVAIARDVVKQIKSAQLVPVKGKYVYLRGGYSQLFVNQPHDKQVNTILQEKQITCEVCARGALFIAGLKRFNNLKVDDIPESSSSFQWILREQYEKNFFEEQQMLLIERCFEATKFPNKPKLRELTGPYYAVVVMAAQKFRQKYSTGIGKQKTSNLLIAIAKNIIRNNGNFVIPRDIWRSIGVSSKISVEINNHMSHRKLI